jgi:hypothetical protein
MSSQLNFQKAVASAESKREAELNQSSELWELMVGLKATKF